MLCSNCIFLLFSYPDAVDGESYSTRTDDDSYLGTDDISCHGERLDDILSVSMRTDDAVAELRDVMTKVGCWILSKYSVISQMLYYTICYITPYVLLHCMLTLRIV